MPSSVDRFAVDADLVRSLLAEQHPELADLPLLELDPGWDNSLWRLGEQLLVRLPRRSVAAPLTVNEQRWLPEVAPRLPLPVPAPVRVGHSSEDYPWSWSVVPWLEGCSGDRTPLTEQLGAATRLGEFLRALHTEAPSDAPHNPFRGVQLEDRATSFDALATRLAADVDVRAARRVWDGGLVAGGWTRPRVWVHGDLHPANTLLLDGNLAAVIDSGDLCAGDPATDIAGPGCSYPRPPGQPSPPPTAGSIPICDEEASGGRSCSPSC